MPRKKSNKDAEGRPAKRTKLLSDEGSSDSDVEGVNGVALSNGNTDGELKINQEFAKRFEHNKKREERQRLEEKYSKNLEDDSDDETTDESEDDDAEFATRELDAEIFATLNALKSKDPRIYDEKSTFYRPFEAEAGANEDVERKEKPMTLQDYHRKNLLSGGLTGDAEEAEPVQTYDQEQESLRRSMVSQMHAAVDGDEDDGFLVKKAKHIPATATKKRLEDLDIAGADKDPETFLSNFMSARAWVPEEDSRFAHLDSDDSADEKRADEFEEAYNLRFEDPAKANEKLMSFSRDLAKQSVRREEMNPRQRLREREREIKDQKKQERREEKARLRRLKIEEVEQKVQQVREAAGLGATDVVDLAEWRDMIEGDWDDNKWEQEMERRFGDKYYAEKDRELGAGDDDDDDDEEAETEEKKSKKVKKPKWDDDIDIKDLVPDFEEDDEKPAVNLTDDEADEDEVDTAAKPEKRKSRKEQAVDRKRAARQQRMQIEELVDNQMDLDLPSKAHGSGPGIFRYRETSPISFGLTARDILFADDTQLNQFAGIKKHHAFREEEKKNKDKKKLGKKARLRSWRRETFGNEDGYAGDFASYVRSKGGFAEEKAPAPAPNKASDKDGEGSKKKRKRKRKGESEAT